MKARTEALQLLEQIKALQEESGFSFEVAARAIAMQALIFERLNPELWEIALTDAHEGLSRAVPKTHN